MGKLRDFFKPIDMTVGSPARNIVMFAIPMLLGNIAQQLYNTVDSIIVGKFVVTMPWRQWAVRDRS